MARDKRGRILPSMTRANVIKMLFMPEDASVNLILRVAERTMKHNYDVRCRFSAMCCLEENASTGMIKKSMKQMISA